MMKKVLEIGSGFHPIKGDTNEEVIHLDRMPLPHVEVVHDANTCLPFKENSFDRLESYDCIEHISDTVFIMEEIYRVLKPGGIAIIEVPYYACTKNFSDPSHKNSFTEHTMNYFSENFKWNYYSHARFKILETKFIYNPKLWFIPFKRYLRYFMLNMVIRIKFVLRATKE